MLFANENRPSVVATGRSRFEQAFQSGVRNALQQRDGDAAPSDGHGDGRADRKRDHTGDGRVADARQRRPARARTEQAQRGCDQSPDREHRRRDGRKRSQRTRPLEVALESRRCANRIWAPA